MIRFKIKKLFFDTKTVRRRINATTRRVLSRFGAFVRRTAKSSIRKRKKPSQPGSPPSSHTGLLKRLIFFGYEPNRKSVVIGPVRLSRKVGDAPETLEHGGMSAVLKRGKKKRTRIAKRSYMGPAMDREKPQLPKMWRDSI